MNNYPNELGERDGKYYSIRQVEFMICQFGLPRRIDTGVTEAQLKMAA